MSAPRSSTKRAQPNTDGPRRNAKLPKTVTADLATLSLEEVKTLGADLVQSADYTIERGAEKNIEKGLYFVTRAKIFNAAQIKQQEIAAELYVKEHEAHETTAKDAIKNMVLTSVQWNNVERLAALERSLDERISQDPVLRGQYSREFSPKMDKGLLEFCAAKLGYIFSKAAKQEEEASRPKGKSGKRRGKGKKKATPAAIEASEVSEDAGAPEVPDVPAVLPPVTELTPAVVELIRKLTYQCPETRTLLTRAGGMMGTNEISVYCDLSSPLREQTGYHNGLIFEYTDKTFVDPKKYPDVVAHTEKAERKENLISCKCCSSGSVVPCYMNPECVCYQTNVELRRLQVKTSEGYPDQTQFHSFKPTLFGGNQDFQSTIGFACSEMCGCKGNCTNNATLIPGKKIYPLELFRIDPIIGFALRSMAGIPAGTMMAEYTGELVEGALMVDVHQDYAFDLALSPEATVKVLTGAGNWTQKFRGEVKSQMLCNWSIDSKRMGNVARFVSHSCFPNSAFIRVFQKGFSPAHCRIFLITLVDVFPGTELTIDYGADYVEQNFKGGCLCKSFACRNNPEAFKMISELSGDSRKAFFALSQYSEFNRYQQILDSSQ